MLILCTEYILAITYDDIAQTYFVFVNNDRWLCWIVYVGVFSR